jgi:tetratricopeptide (TPR) repeat protein
MPDSIPRRESRRAVLRACMPIHNEVNAAAFGAALSRVISSDIFRSSPHLSAFLQFVSDAALRGEQDRIKAYTIGVEALGRRPDFNPDTDNIVRVEAGRLRRALLAYYAGEGAQDEIVIEIPRGSYVPRFTRRELYPPVPAARRRKSLWAVAVTIAAVALSIILYGTGWTPLSANKDRSVVRVPAIQIAAIDATASRIAQPVRDKLIHTLSQFGNLRVLSGSVAAARPTTARIVNGTLYRLSILPQQSTEGGSRLTVMLIAADDGAVVWSDTFSRTETIDEMEDATRIARHITAKLAGAFGTINNRERQIQDTLDTPFGCILGAFDYMRSFDFSMHVRVRGCLERGTKDNPNYSSNFTLLALLLAREHISDLDIAPQQPSPLDRALRAAQQAVLLKPDSAWAHMALLQAYYLNGDLERAFEAGERAIAENPLDPIVAGVYGSALIFGGRIDRGESLVREVAHNFIVAPPWIALGLFLADYMHGNIAEAARRANSDPRKELPMSRFSRALAAAAEGKQQTAKTILRKLAVLHPNWERPRERLQLIIKSPEILDRLEADYNRIMHTK